MSFTRQKAEGWSKDDPITPAEIEGIDLNLSNALDKTGGDTVTGASSWEAPLTMGQSATSVAWRVDTTTITDVPLSQIDCSADEFILPSLSASRTVRLRKAAPFEVPVAGARIRVSSSVDNTPFTVLFELDDTVTVIARFNVGQGAFVDFTYSGSEWFTSAVGGFGAWS